MSLVVVVSAIRLRLLELRQGWLLPLLPLLEGFERVTIKPIQLYLPITYSIFTRRLFFLPIYN